MTYYRLYIHFKKRSIYRSKCSPCICGDCLGNIFKFIKINHIGHKYYIISICINCDKRAECNIDAYNVEKFKTEVYNKIDWITV